MIARGLAVWAWLFAGHALAAALYWGLVNVPESNVAMLTLSALLAVAVVSWSGLVEMTALGALVSRRGLVDGLRASPRRLPWFLAALAAWASCAWLAGLIDAWHASARGEIDAWLIARFDTPDAPWLHAGLAWGATALRWVLGVSLAVALAATPFASAPRTWLARGLHWQPLVVTGVSLLLFVALPWRLVEWRPASLPPTWVEPAFVAAKLAVVYAVATAGWLLVLLAAARRFPREAFDPDRPPAAS